MKLRFFVLSLAVMCATIGVAHANWEYDGEYVGDGVYSENGSHFYVGIRGGASYAMAKIENKAGPLRVLYAYNTADPGVYDYYSNVAGTDGALPDGWAYAGYVNIGDVPVAENYSDIVFTMGASFGYLPSRTSNWRIEAGWDRINVSEYNPAPLFKGEVGLIDSPSTLFDNVANEEIGVVKSKIETDVLSVMAFHDFFDGRTRPLNAMIPYIGIGLGYASTTTILNMYDGSNNVLGEQQELHQFAVDENDPYTFSESKTENSNVTGLAAIGISYAFSKNVSLDLGIRAMYIPQVRWTLYDINNDSHRDWFNGKNLIYTNATLGLRYEF